MNLAHMLFIAACQIVLKSTDNYYVLVLEIPNFLIIVYPLPTIIISFIKIISPPMTEKKLNLRHVKGILSFLLFFILLLF